MSFALLAHKLETYQLALIMLAIVLLAIILFALTGFTSVKKNYVAIIEKMGNFVGVYKPGFYYFIPLLYRKVGTYKMDELNKIVQVDDQEYKINYEIVDVKMFHYIGKDDVKSVLTSSLANKKDNLSKTLTEQYKRIGVKFISLEKIIER